MTRTATGTSASTAGSAACAPRWVLVADTAASAAPTIDACWSVSSAVTGAPAAATIAAASGGTVVFSGSPGVLRSCRTAGHYRGIRLRTTEGAEPGLRAFGPGDPGVGRERPAGATRRAGRRRREQELPGEDVPWDSWTGCSVAVSAVPRTGPATAASTRSRTRSRGTGLRGTHRRDTAGR